jgi:hypothetical protein
VGKLAPATEGFSLFQCGEAVNIEILPYLESRGVTELSLLFGSTWMVNAVVIGAFLTLGFLANVIVLVRPMPVKVMYAMLFLSLMIGLVLPAAAFAASSLGMKLLPA